MTSLLSSSSAICKDPCSHSLEPPIVGLVCDVALCSTHGGSWLSDERSCLFQRHVKWREEKCLEREVYEPVNKRSWLNPRNWGAGVQTHTLRFLHCAVQSTRAEKDTWEIKWQVVWLTTPPLLWRNCKILWLDQAGTLWKFECETECSKVFAKHVIYPCSEPPPPLSLHCSLWCFWRPIKEPAIWGPFWKPWDGLSP